MRTPISRQYPYLVCSYDHPHGVQVYYRCRSLHAAEIVSTGMRKFWSIVKIVHWAQRLHRGGRDPRTIPTVAAARAEVRRHIVISEHPAPHPTPGPVGR